jgi:hypothetical protein
MPEIQNTYENHLHAINDYNLQNKYVTQNVSIHKFFSLPVTDTEEIGNDISTYNILKGTSTCIHLSKYIVAVEDTMDHNMLSIHTSYDHFMNVTSDSITYVIYERITDCITCSIIGAMQ